MARAAGASRQVTGSRRPTVPAVVGFAVALLAAAYWLVVFRWHLVQGDDFTNAARAGHPRAAMSAAEWWASYVHDYTQVNGRLADAAVRLVMIPGHWLWQILGPVAFATVSWQLYGWGLEGGRWRAARGGPTGEGEPRGLPWWAAGLLAAAAAVVLPLLVWRVPGVTGDALFWTSATITYVVPAVLVFTVAAAASGLARGRAPGRARIAVVAAVILLAELMQEESALAVAVVVVVAYAVSATRPRLPWAWVVAAVLGLAIKLAAPGIRVRVGTMSEADTAPLGPGELLRRAANAVQVISWAAAPALLAAGVLTLVTVLVLWRCPATGLADGSVVSRRALLLALAGGLVATAAVLGGWWLAAYRSGTGLQALDLSVLRASTPRGVALGSVGLWGVALAGFVVVGFALRRLWGPGPLLLLAAAVGGLLPPLVIGVLTPRGYVLSYVLLTAVPVLFAGALLDLGAGRGAGRGARAGVAARVGAVVAAATCAAGVVAAVPVAARIPGDMADNARVWAGVERQMDQVRDGRCRRIEMSHGFPHPAYVYGNGFSTWYEPGMTLYFDLPAGTIWDRSGASDCPA